MLWVGVSSTQDSSLCVPLHVIQVLASYRIASPNRENPFAFGLLKQLKRSLHMFRSGSLAKGSIPQCDAGVSHQCLDAQCGSAGREDWGTMMMQ